MDDRTRLDSATSHYLAVRQAMVSVRGGWKLVIRDARDRAIIVLRDEISAKDMQCQTIGWGWGVVRLSQTSVRKLYIIYGHTKNGRESGDI